MDGSAVLNAANYMFGWTDLIIFGLMLFASLLIGVYFAYFDTKSKDTTDDYLVGGRSMGTLPVALSLVASFVSGITVLGNAAETYVYGCQFMYYLLAIPLWGWFFCSQTLPVIREIQGHSVYEYFVVRFNKSVRLIGSMLFVTSNITWLPIVIFVPALAFQQVTSVNLHYVTPVVSLICIYYTTIGGIKAVVWTDAIQTVFMVICVILILIKGSMDVGGLGVVWDRSFATSRFEPPLFDVSPLTRHTFFTQVVGGFFALSMSSGLNQSMVQRYLALPDAKEAKKAVWYYVVGITFFLGFCAFNGLVLYAHHYDCDPVNAKLASRADQLLPLFVMETLGVFPGLPGLFMAGVFSAALSSMSTGLNSIAGVVLEDWIIGFGRKDPTEKQAGWILRAVVVVLGVIVVGLVFVVEKLGMVVQLSVSLGAISIGPLLSLFMIGMFVPWANTKAAVFGTTVAGIFNALVIFGAQFALASGNFRSPPKPMSVEGCAARYNLTADLLTSNTTALPASNESVLALFRISYMWYAPLSLVIAMVMTGVAVLAGWRSDLRHVNPSHFAPVVRRWLPTDNIYLSAENSEKVQLADFAAKPVTSISTAVERR